MRKKIVVIFILVFTFLFINYIYFNYDKTLASENLDNMLMDLEIEIKNLEKSSSAENIVFLSNPFYVLEEIEMDEKIVEVGVEIIPVLYKKINVSSQQGLIEYIYGVLIERIMQDNFVYDSKYGWATSKEFCVAFERKLNEIEKNYNSELSDEEIFEMGLGVVPYLIENDEKEKLIKLLKGKKIISDNDNIETWIDKNKDYYMKIKASNLF